GRNGGPGRGLTPPGARCPPGPPRRGRGPAPPAPAPFFFARRPLLTLLCLRRPRPPPPSPPRLARLPRRLLPTRPTRPTRPSTPLIRRRSVERPHDRTAAVEDFKRQFLRGLLQPVRDLRRVRVARCIGRLEQVRI